MQPIFTLPIANSWNASFVGKFIVSASPLIAEFCNPNGLSFAAIFLLLTVLEPVKGCFLFSPTCKVTSLAFALNLLHGNA